MRPLGSIPLGGLALAACVTATPKNPATAPESDPAVAVAVAEPVADAATTETTDAKAPAETPAPVLVLHTSADLDPWRESLDFGRVLFGLPEGSSTKQLRRSAAYRSLIENLGPGAFPKWWLGHPRTHFALVAIVNRLDRRDMRPDTCGETRLLYRLEHRGETDQRRLPASFNVVFAQPDDGHDCADIAKSWFVGGDAHEELDQPGRPLHADRLTGAQLLAVEVNLREDDPDDGETINRLSVQDYNVDKDRFKQVGFEFEPGRLLWKGRGWRRLVNELTSPNMLEALRVGTPQMAGGYYGAWDVTLHAPDRQDPLLLEAMKNAKHTPVDFGPFETAEATAHRIATLGCSGCHQQRSVGGFHLPGDGGPSSLQGGLSAHLVSELPWRRAYVEAVAAGETPDNVRKHPHAGPPGFGESCSTPTSPVDDLSCQPGHRCEPVAHANFGTCLPEDYDGPAPCDSDDDPACEKPSDWFPGGFVAQPCEDGRACAPVPTEADARACGGQADFWACLAEQAQPHLVDACDGQSDCRDGYACTRVPDSAQGACVPAHGVPELRSHGHARVVR